MNLDLMARSALHRVVTHINRSAATHIVWMRRKFGGAMDKEEVRGEISEMLMHVPNLSKYDHTGVVEFKKLCETASRAMRSPKSSLERLVDVRNQLRAYHQ